MARINSNISSLIAQANLRQANGDLDMRLERLATGLRINRGKDDPAGLIISERLSTDIAGIEQAMKNGERASMMIATTEASLSEINELLNSIKALMVEAANTGANSREEREANQLQIDSAIDSITRVANTASFGGLKLLNRQLGYNLSSVDASNIAKAKVNSALFADRTVVDVDVEVIGSAQQGALYFNTNYTDAGFFPGTNGTNTLDSLPRQITVEVAGPNGVVEITLASGSTNAQIIQAVNDRTGITGVTASPVSATNTSSGIVFNSVEYGEDAFVSVDILSGDTLSGSTDTYTFAKLDNNAPGPIDWGTPAQWSATDRDEGKDVVVLLNGAIAQGNGLEVKQRGPELDVELLLTSGFATTVNNTPTSFEITGGGALFQLGPQVNANQQVSVGVDSIAATRLGGSFLRNEAGTLELMFLSSLKSGGENDLRGNLQNASKILEQSIDEVSTLRGRLGAFERNVLDTNIRSLQAGIENITSAESIIRDADFAEETAKLTRAQVLSQSGTQVLSLANNQAQQVLQLLG
jgi:flagellin